LLLRQGNLGSLLHDGRPVLAEAGAEHREFGFELNQLCHDSRNDRSDEPFREIG
jgi:hypothetical protein